MRLFFQQYARWCLACQQYWHQDGDRWIGISFSRRIEGGKKKYYLDVGLWWRHWFFYTWSGNG